MKINVIVAYSDNFIIGNNNDIPWNYNEDLKNFRKITSLTEDKNKKNVLIMGNNTFLSLNSKPLKNRINMVLTTRNNIESDIDDVYFYNALCDSMDMCKKLIYENKIEKIFIIGGESIYEYFFKSYYYKYLDKVYITRIHKNIEGDRYFYGLESKFYYTNIYKSTVYPELEYRELQYDSNFINPELDYFNEIRYMLTKNILNSHDQYTLHIDLNYYFPLFSIISEIKKILDHIFTTLHTKIIVDQINDIIERKQTEVINGSNYSFIFDDDTNSLSMIIKQESIDLINDFIYNLLFGSLLLRFVSKLMNLKANTIDCICNKYYIMKEDKDIVESIVWVVPDVLPILKINGNQEKITDFKYEDLEFLGNII